MASSKEVTNLRELQRELANREHNLMVIEETIKSDPQSGAKLAEVRELLANRVSSLRNQVINYSRPKVEIAALN